MYNQFFEYVSNNKVIAIVITYMIFSVLLKIIFEIDVTIPCLWKFTFGFDCPGCGLTTAFISLLELDFRKAFESNWLIYLIFPTAFYLFIQDYVKFTRNSAF